MTASNPNGLASDHPSAEGYDFWLIGGLVLLVVLSLGAVLVYRSAPRTIAQARTESWLAARPNAVGANLARGRERLERAAQEAAAGNDSAAAAIDSVAAEHGWRAASLAATRQERREGLSLWAAATLHRAEMLRIRGTGTGLRPDDDPTLRRALDLVVRVDSIASDGATRARADSLRLVIERQLRLGPLEWLPQ